MKVEVMSITRVPSLPRVLARVSIRLSDEDGDVIALDDVRILANNRGVKYIAMPQYRDRASDGSWGKWIPCVSLPTALQYRVQLAVLQAYQEYLREEETERVKWLAAHSDSAQ